jgi:RimJ/RimL family protein N-acetyltransferase
VAEPRPSGPNVSLRDVTEADLRVFFEHQRDPDAYRMAAFTPRDETAFLDHWHRILADERVAKRTVLVDGQVAGNVVSFGEPADRLVGYWIGRDFWGRGVATAALRAFLEVERHRPLVAHVAEANVASIRVLERCGFAVVRREIGPPDADGDPVRQLVMRLDA